MKVNTVDNNKIDIILSDDEVNRIFGGYGFIDYDAPDCRIKIHNLLTQAIPETLLPLDCNKILIEVKPRKSGCTISLTKISTAAKKLRKAKHFAKVTLIFENSENLIAALSLLNGLNCAYSELYSKGKRFALVLALNEARQRSLIRITEYCEFDPRPASAGRVQEYWNCICKKCAVKKLAAAFLE